MGLDRETLAVPGEHDAIDLTLIGIEAAQLGFRPGVDDADTLRGPGEGDELPIGMEREGADFQDVVLPRGLVRNTARLELDHGDVRGETHARFKRRPHRQGAGSPRRELKVLHHADLRVDPADEPAVGRIPDPEDAVLAAGDEPLAIGRVGDAIDGRVLAILDRAQPHHGSGRQRIAVPVELPAVAAGRGGIV